MSRAERRRLDRGHRKELAAETDALRRALEQHAPEFSTTNAIVS